MILSLDPGRQKCGLAVIDGQGTVSYKEIILTEEIKKSVSRLTENYSLDMLILGSGTNSDYCRKLLSSLFQEIIIIDETNSTLQAREYYWQDNPPTGWRKLVPVSLQQPPVPIDDYAAVVLGLRYLKTT